MDFNKPKISLLSIQLLMEKGVLSNPYEIKEQDYREHVRIDCLGGGFGFVQNCDIGKLVFLKGKFIQMENDVQLQERKDRNKKIPNFTSNLRFTK